MLKFVLHPGAIATTVKGFVDFVGCVPGGRMICFDAKSSSNPLRFPLNSQLPAHQRDALIVFGLAGAISGLVIESTASEKFFWLDWDDLGENSIPWNDSRLILLGEKSRRIHFENIPAVKGAQLQ